MERFPYINDGSTFFEGAKRIGLLFSSAEVDFELDPKWIADIDDITSGDENFSDGCGLIAPSLAKRISKAKQIIFREMRYTPSVYQIRYLSLRHRHLSTSLKPTFVGTWDTRAF